MIKKELFITYSWDSEEHNDKVIAFTNHLRDNGFEAEIDKMHSQQESATDFKKMMHKAMTDYEKVIVILSDGYKLKAESFKGGVGTEYLLIIKDIEENTNKYILVSFDPINNNMIPLSFKEREIVDLSQDGKLNTLYAKLKNEELIQFSKVAKEKPPVIKKVVPSFLTKTSNILIDNLSVRHSMSHWDALQLKEITYEISVLVKNNSGSSIDHFTIEIIYPLWATDNNSGGYVNNDKRIFSIESGFKLFSNQTKNFDLSQIIVNYKDASKLQDSYIAIKIYSEFRTFEKDFLLSDILTYKHRYEGEKKLAKEIFIKK